MENNIVSFNNELLILVDENDNEIGYLEKNKCHQGNGILHKAFSIFLINDKKELLLQKRSPNKLLWGNYWSNSVCSHPRKGESIELATNRRLRDELGIELDNNLHFLFKFQYFAQFENIGCERELCSVFAGKYSSPIYPNKNEISDIKYIPLSLINDELSRNNSEFTPWFKIEWQRISEEFIQFLNDL
ncbi:MAG TPA: isopentenyl-diphosphate Delta-isomerase [Candidatus Kapabacteria bacterium]|jgi:isopentenyl-diphosphate delta-isomerase|nr:isopentenyl-diphosphate Delta-isomerase [Candidatus Kapabacteria bacterium]HOV91970.1 isopentenyl-diphosphate Delta-isomerase [Candidatus Kapabacteria bacterium]